jgi:hypothetical protein
MNAIQQQIVHMQTSGLG